MTKARNLKNADISDEFIVKKFRRGVQLVKFDSSITHELTVKDILNFEFNTYFLNQKSQIEFFNEAVVSALDLSSTESLKGKTILDFDGVLDGKKAIIEDQYVLRTQSLLITETFIQMRNIAPLEGLTLKFPWYNENEVLVGILGFSIILDKFTTLHGLYNSLRSINQIGIANFSALTATSICSKLPGSVLFELYFSRGEMKIISFLAKGQTSKNIAKNLYRSTRTIERHIENMKLKTGCATKFELVELLNHLQEN